MSKFSLVELSSNIVSPSCFFFSIEAAESYMSTLIINPGTPFFTSWAPNDTFESALAVYLCLTVAHILSPRTFSDVIFSVVKRVVVFVVSMFLGFTSNNLSMHIYIFFIFTISYGVKITRIHCDAPIPLRQADKVFGIDNGYFASRKWNVAVKWVRWLGNRGPLNSALWHVPTPIGMCLPSHLTLAGS